MAESTPARGEGKICKGECGELKPPSEFGSNGYGGLTGSCKSCRASVERERRKRNAAQHAETPPTPASGTLKRCSVGGEVRPIGEFSKSRDTKDGCRSACKEHHSANRRARYKRDPEVRARAIEHAVRWRAANPGRAAERARVPEVRAHRLATARARYHRMEPEERARRHAAGAAWRRANPAKVAAWGKAWREANPDAWREKARRSASKRRARLRGLPAEPYTVEQLLARDGTDCVLCSTPLALKARRPDPNSLTIEHLECVSWPDSAGDIRTNVALAHYACNQKRSDRPHPAAAAKRAALLAAEAALI